MSDYRLLPEFIYSTRSVLNPKNHDNKSFGHALVYFYHPNDWGVHPDWPTIPIQERFRQHGLDKINYPVTLQDIKSTLEDQLDLRINVFTFDDPEGYKRRRLYTSPKEKKEDVNLLFWDGRFALIRHFSRLFNDVRLYVFLISGFNPLFIYRLFLL
jgi:hypothetical protein